MTYPTIRPELTLDFANSRQLDPRVTFSRSSSATYLNPDTGLITTASDHEARFEKEGLLIEESRTNLLTYSEQFDQWTKGSNTTVTANAAIAPDGSMTADRAEFPATGSTYIAQNSVIVAGTTYTGSVWVKAVTPGTNAQFSLQYGSNSGEVTSYFTATGEWQRFTSTASPTTPGAFHINNHGDTFASDIYIWGAQLEANASFPTSYIPTSGSTVTRSADVAQITGDNFSSWYNGSQGSFVAMCDYKKNSVYNMIVEGVGGGTLRDFSVGVGAGNPNFVTRYSYTALDITPAGGPILNNTPFKLAGAYSSSGSAAVFNGGAVGTTGAITSVSTPADSMTIGHRIGGGLNLNGNISRLSYYTRRLTDSELQTITS